MIEQRMRLNDPEAYRRGDELSLLTELVAVEGRRVLELGCGAAFMTRVIAQRLGAAEVMATEVDRIQHERNLAAAASEGLDRIQFRYGGAESIAAPDASFDLVFMLKSLHHVPVDRMDQALSEIHRVLVPDGLLYVSEPVYWGEFNALMCLIEDEQAVRRAASEALCRAVDAGRFELVEEVFIESEGVYADWETFAARFIQVTHREQVLDAARLARIRAAFERHLTDAGARFWKPHRIDVLRRRAPNPHA